MNPPDSKRLSIVVVNYDTWADVHAQIQVLSRSAEIRDGRAELIVVDNDSPTKPEWPDEPFPGVIRIDREENGGFGAGVNTGWRQSRGEWILLLNPDVVVSDDLLNHVLALLDEIDRKHEAGSSLRVGIVGVALTNPDGSRQPSVGAFPSVGRGFLELFLPRSRRRYQIVSPQKFGPVDWVTGAFFLVRSEVMAELGGFDEDYFLYFEETDFCLRAKRAGWATCFDPTITVCHQKPLQNRNVSPKIRLLTRHSRLLYFRKNTSPGQFRIMMSLVHAEAWLRCQFARLGFGQSNFGMWKAVQDLVRTFREHEEPQGIAVLDWAERAIAQWH
ncbi:glycosyltransferase [bacterium]|nr:glycosyltransferase [bacterium]